MPTTDTHKLDNLPHWAQNEINNLRARVARLEEAAGLIEGDPTKPGVYIYDITAGLHRPLGDAMVRFQVLDPADNPNSYYGMIEAMITTRSGSPRLQLRSPFGALFVRPDSANQLYVEATGDW